MSWNSIKYLNLFKAFHQEYFLYDLKNGVILRLNTLDNFDAFI